MAYTKLADLAIVPETFQRYALEKAVETSAFFRSGIVAQAGGVEMPTNGTTTNMPFYTDLSGEAEILSDSAGLTVNSISSKNMRAAIHFQGKAFGSNDLVGWLSGADPMANMVNGVGEFWARQFNRVAIASAKGAIAAGGEGVAYVDVSDAAGAAANIAGAALLDTQQLLGDHQDKIAGYVMHSAVRNFLRKTDIANFEQVRGSDQTLTETYFGKPIIVDDTLAATAGVYTTYAFAGGALAFADGTPAQVALETDRDKLTGNDLFTTRARYVLHVNGYDFNPDGGADMEKISPSTAELASAAKWNLKVNAKNQGVVALLHKIA